jgi:MFS family permease
LGNGMQGTPKEALIRDVTPDEKVGVSYGLVRMFGMAGAAAGGILAWIAMFWTDDNFTRVFEFAIIPSSIALIALCIWVKEPKEAPKLKDKAKRHPLHMSDIKRLGTSYWWLMVLVALFMMSRVSEAFVILNADAFGLSHSYIPLVTFVYNISYSLSSIPIGMMADRIDRYKILFAGLILLIISDLILAFSRDLTDIFIGIFIWGIQYAIMQNIFSTIIAHMVPEDLRGTGFGIYYLISAIVSVMTGYIEGHIADFYNISYTFIVSSMIASLTLIAFFFLMPKLKPKNS